MIKWLLGALLLLAPSLALAQNQGQIVPSGSFTSGHTARCQNSTCTVAVDGGGAAGSNKNGQGYLTEIGITNTGTPLCISDALINAAGGYHQFCLGANALGGGLISYNAYGSASPLALTFNINGTNYPFPGNGNGNVMGPNSSTINNIPTFNNNSGSLLKDSGMAQQNLSGGLQVSNNYNPVTANATGLNPGCRFWTGANPATATPSIGDTVVCTLYVDNTLNSGRGVSGGLWTIDAITLQVPGGPDNATHSIEVEVSNLGAAPNDPFANNLGARKNGIELVGHTSSTTNPTSAAWIWGANASSATWWNFGVSISRVNLDGLVFGDYASDTTTFSDAAILDESHSTRVLNIKGTHSIIMDMSTTTLPTIFVKGSPSADTNVFMTNVANHAMTLDIDSGAGTPQTSGVVFSDNGTAKWIVEKNNGNAFIVFNEATSKSDILIDGSTDAITLGGTVNFGGAINFSASTTGGVTPAFTNAPTGCTNVQWIGPLTIASPSLTNVYLASCHS